MLKAHPIATPDKNVQQIHGNEHGRKLSDRAEQRICAHVARTSAASVRTNLASTSMHKSSNAPAPTTLEAAGESCTERAVAYIIIGSSAPY